MNLNDLLLGKNVDPRNVLVLRHRPWESELNKVFPLLAADRPDLFNAYQQAQGEKLEKAMAGMVGDGHIASFIAHGGARALFIGLYKINSATPITNAQYRKMPLQIELKAQGMDCNENERTILWFDLALEEFYGDWKGKLIVDWPPPDRSWWRRADRNVIPVRAILEESALDEMMKDWNELEFTWSQLSVLPKRWRAKLSEWRAIYYIFDISDRKGYVGSAYGVENLWGRWLNYAATGHGGNRLLRKRDPQHFRFSILQRVSPDLDAEEVIRLEATWKDRLHTRAPVGLNDN